VRFHTVEIEDRRELGAYTLLSYRWPGEGIEPGRFVMARGAATPSRSTLS
jgi:hypothetical protein